MTNRLVGKSPLLAAPYGTSRQIASPLSAIEFARYFHPTVEPVAIRADVVRAVRYNSYFDRVGANVFSHPVFLPPHFGPSP